MRLGRQISLMSVALCMLMLCVPAWAENGGNVHWYDQDPPDQQSRMIFPQRPADNLDLQERCANQARRVFYQMGGNNYRDTYQSHYSAARGKCFMEMEKYGVSGSVTKLLLDAFEQRLYATFLKPLNLSHRC